ncbi:copper homeostasis membrane protein CopD [Collimonas sp.]|jgi:putative copper resistance protein D|uniref:copper homeostasis membrane protein CopD n=1 Tax=Collimonas sp. TaxID=1963772 RepID=UPI002C81A6AC|nr:copper homeostasis membrane protein CopD [Collimonas sp.]HWX04082.1 copper homeostasis membrane protein CopD [Collimonas sp.]
MTLDAVLDTVIAGNRLLHYLASMLIFGSSAFLWKIAAPGLRMQLDRRLAFSLRAALLLALLTVLAGLPLQAAEIVGSWQAALDPALLQKLLGTAIGQAWLLRLLLALLLLAVSMLRQPGRLGALVVSAGLLLASLALNGHAAMDQGLRGFLHGANHIVHLLCGGAWLGSLLPFLLCLRLLDYPVARNDAGLTLRRFSSAGHVAVAGVLLSGVVNTMLVLGRWPTDWSSPYQLLLSLKILLTAAMVTLAIVNRYVQVPRMQSDARLAVAAIRRCTLIEIGLGMAVLALVSVFGMLEPV